jgi:hypothetical protein
MNTDSLLSHDWSRVVERLGGVVRLTDTARETKAFQRPRGVRDAVSLLRLVSSPIASAAEDCAQQRLGLRPSISLTCPTLRC